MNPTPDPLDGEYQSLQKIYLDWHSGRRPLSGFIRELQKHEAQAAVAAVDHALETVHKVIDNYSIHQPKGWPKGTLARQRLHARIRKISKQLQKEQAASQPEGTE